MKRLIFNLIRFLKAKKKKLELSYYDFLSDKLKKEGDRFFKSYKIRGNKNLNNGIVAGGFLNKRFLLQCKINDEIENRLLIGKIWDRSLMELIAQVLEKRGGAMIDIGANVGAISIPLAVAFPDHVFYCFEPHPGIFNRLQKNIHLNHLQNIITVQQAASDLNGEISFFAQTESGNMGLSSMLKHAVTSDKEEITVTSVTIDKYVTNQIKSDIVLIKIDVQGGEINVLRGMREVLKIMRPALIFEHEDSLHATKAAEVRNDIAFILKSHNYKMYAIDTILLDEFGFIPELDLLQPFEGNILALPE